MTDEELGRLRAHADGALDELESRRVEAELAASPAARQQLEQLRRLDASVAALLRIDDHAQPTADAWQAFEARRARSSPRRALAVVAGLVASLAAAILLIVLWPRPASRTSGSIAAADRETVAIGERAIAVAEPGASLAWEVEPHGRGHVRQSAGTVFYRVDAGDAFDVETPGGRVTVTGTCFTVEIEPMNSPSKHLASAAAGAAITAGVLLTVHEGSVVLGNEHGDVEVAAGDQARAWSGEAPALDDGATRVARATATTATTPARETRFETLVRENQAQREQLRRLDAELRAHQGQATGGRAPEVDRASPEHRLEIAKACARSGDCDDKLWTDPSPEELVELARCNRLLVDTPPFMGGGAPYFFPDGHVIEAAGLSEAEANRFAELADAYQRDVTRELEGLAAELGLPASLVERMSAVQLQGLVEAVIDPETHDATRRRFADERAGLEPARPVEEQSAGERALRLVWSEGDGFERTLAAEFGADAAREMRGAHGGWGMKWSTGDSTCRE